MRVFALRDRPKKFGKAGMPHGASLCPKSFHGVLDAL